MVPRASHRSRTAYASRYPEEGDRCIEGGIANEVGSEWTGEQAGKAGRLLCNVRVSSDPDRLRDDDRQSRDASNRDTTQHHLMRGNECPVTPNQRVPLDVPTRPKEADESTEKFS